MSDRHVTNEPTPWAMVPEALLYDPTISDKAVRLYGVLRRHGEDPENCYPSKKRLAGFMGCAPASIHRPMTELEDAGWVRRQRRFDEHGAETSSGYYVNLARTSSATPALESAPPPRAEAEGPRAPARAKRESLERESENEKTRASEPLVLLAPDNPGTTFDAFWKAYPRGDGKPAAVKAWEGALRKAPPERIMEGLAAWVAHWEAKNDPQWIPWAQKWLNQEQWNATPPAVARRSAQRDPLGPGSTTINDAWAGVASGVIDAKAAR